MHISSAHYTLLNCVRNVGEYKNIIKITIRKYNIIITYFLKFVLIVLQFRIIYKIIIYYCNAASIIITIYVYKFIVAEINC